jgi:hypothetical protein
MKDRDIAESSQSKLISNIVIVLLFLGAMASAIAYFNNSEPNIKAEIMDNLAEQFSRNVTNAHWQWQAEGRPQMIMLVQYDNEGKERGRQPLRMSSSGWPFVDDNSDSCENLWQGILYIPLRVDGFRVIGEYFENNTDDQAVTERRCRFRVSTGPYFDYYVNSGRVVRK